VIAKERSVATTQWYRFDFLDGAGFAPGQVRTWEHDWPGGLWFGKAVVVTAQPFDASGQNRSLTVTNVSHISRDYNERRLRYTIQNNGVDTVIIYYVFIGIIAQ
jgi:hypothetical protein